MAWVNNRWIARKERAELIDTYESFLAELDADHPDVLDMPEDIAITYFDKSSELERLNRINRCEGNLLEFSIEYFSDARNPDNDGNWEGFDITRVDEAPDFHQEIASIINVVSTDHVNAKIAAAAPRSHAKSTYLSKAFPVHELVYRLRKYVIIISETPKVSKANMEWIRNQLKFNRKLREDFGPLLSPKDQSNIQDNGEGFIAWHYTDGDYRKQVALVEAASTGQALRGRNWNGSRPDLIVLDDLEDARPGGNASTPEQRQSLRDWFSQTVIPLGDPKGKRTAFVYMGTTVHFDALLMQVLYNRSDFQSKVYRAIIDQPSRADLWEQCRLIYIDRENPNRLADALAFYADNEAEMLAGSRVLWPEVQPLWKLMTWKWDNGSKAFNTEYMNNPIDEESMIFNPDTFTYWNEGGKLYNFLSDEFLISMGLDFAFGRERGDYSALHVVARHKENGTIYVIDSFVQRLPIDDYFEVIVDKVKLWQPDVIAADANVAQEFIADQLTKRLDAEGYPATTRLKKIKNRTKKELRIEAMKPDIENGTIRFNKKHTLLLEQFERYGQGANDDGPDSLQMAVSTVVKSTRRKGGNAGNYRY
ncbi:phage terminase large subunit [Cytobacillus purgationiresistens]|uniref:Phage terminase large subunit-like protein n=1 Tax=Cytobacillus purgationiresistens TaxID=863449 RepID=A0ABU0AHK2_9BACI|nr:phage terminase large subunit [Cytobacillus purgationiresistens]MDQ0270734.1 putative phage terminase large subunit-like protein [Cytobacillus purgationiresistens]